VTDSQHVPDDLHYTSDHEWVRVDGDDLVVGITDFAQRELGDVVYVDLPTAGATVEAGQPFGEVESTKSVSDLFAPVDGTITERNEALDETPELVNEDPYGDGWLVRLEADGGLADGDLLDADAYRDLLG
jgi:glycine cleavage system H protein